MQTMRVLSLVLVGVMIGSAASASPKSYVFSGKLTSNRGPFVNIPVFGNVGYRGVGLANLTVMQGPGGNLAPAPDTPPTRTAGMPASGFWGCVKHVPGKPITTTGAGVG